MRSRNVVLVATSAFKESLSSIEACSTMSQSLTSLPRSVLVRGLLPECEVVSLPLADGGDGTLDVLKLLKPSSKIIYRDTLDPTGSKIRARILRINASEYFIEMAEASGLRLVSRGERNPLETSTFGTGILIKHALDLEARFIIIGLGGSATNDGGVGLLEALGARFLDSQDQKIPKGGAGLAHIARVDLSNFDPRLKKTKILVLCDVENPLIGPHGCSIAYSPQKGASKNDVKLLERSMQHYARLIRKMTGLDMRMTRFAGSAGGTAAGLMAFLKARCVSGAEYLLKLAGFHRYLAQARFVITAEGCLDKTTLYGKLVYHVAMLCKKACKPLLIVCGKCKLPRGSLYATKIVELVKFAQSTQESLKNPEVYIKKAISSLLSVIPIQKK